MKERHVIVAPSGAIAALAAAKLIDLVVYNNPCAVRRGKNKQQKRPHPEGLAFAYKN